MADVRMNSVEMIEVNMARLDFASAVFQGMPQDAWQNKLGSDPSAWIDEALAIRKDFLAKMAAMGVNITISNTPIHPVSIGSPPEANPLGALIARAFTVFQNQGVGGAGGVAGARTVPSTAVADLRKALLKALGEADARLAVRLRQIDVYGNPIGQTDGYGNPIGQNAGR